MGVRGKGGGRPLWRILSYLRPYWRISVLAILMLVASVIVELTIPQLIQRIIDQGIGQGNMEVIVNTTALMIGLAFIEALLTIGNTVFAVRASQSFAADVRSASFSAVVFTMTSMFP